VDDDELVEEAGEADEVAEGTGVVGREASTAPPTTTVIMATTIDRLRCVSQSLVGYA